MLNISLTDRKTNIWIREQTKVKEILDIIKEMKWRWAGHVARMKDNRWTVRVTEWTPRYGKRKRGRPSTRWRDEVERVGENIAWNRTAQNRNEWKEHAEAFIQQWRRNRPE